MMNDICYCKHAIDVDRSIDNTSIEDETLLNKKKLKIQPKNVQEH